MVDSVQQPWNVYAPTTGLICGPVGVGDAETDVTELTLVDRVADEAELVVD